MNDAEHLEWLSNQASSEVLPAFLRKVRISWERSGALELVKIDLDSITAEELYLKIERSHDILLFLDKLIVATRQYALSRSTLSIDDPGLDRLQMIAHDWAMPVSIAKDLSQLLLQQNSREQASKEIFEFFKKRLGQINSMVKDYSKAILKDNIEDM